MTSNNTTGLDLDAIEARVNAATEGPWGVYESGPVIEIAADLKETGCGYRARRGVCRLEDEPLDNDPTHREWTAEEDWAQVQADAKFIAHAPEDIRALLDTVRRLQRQRKYLIDQLAKRDAETGRGDAALREFLATSDPICGDPNDGDWCELEPGHEGHHQADTAEWAQHPAEDASTPV